MELPDIPAPEIKINPINKSESVRFTKAEFEQIKQVINYQQIQITSLEAQKSALNTDLEISKQTINRIKNKPYVLENERLSTEDKFPPYHYHPADKLQPHLPFDTAGQNPSARP